MLHYRCVVSNDQPVISERSSPVLEGVEMKSPLPLTAAVVLKEAAKCIEDARTICRGLGEHEADQVLGRQVAELEPIARALHERAQSGGDRQQGHTGHQE